MDSEEGRLRGVVREVSLERDEGHFRSFNLKVGVVVKGEKDLSYEEGEVAMRRLRRLLLGREVELAVASRCSRCGKIFNSAEGLKRHMRSVHGAEMKGKEKEPEKGSKREAVEEGGSDESAPKTKPRRPKAPTTKDRISKDRGKGAGTASAVLR